MAASKCKKSIKISDKEKIFGYNDNKIENYIINMCALNTKTIIYKMRQDCNQMKESSTRIIYLYLSVYVYVNVTLISI